MSVCRQIAAGTTVSWDVPATDLYDSSAWSLEYRLVSAARNYSIPATAASEGSGWSVTIAATETATYSPGEYTAIPLYRSGAEVRRGAPRPVTVTADITAGAAVDSRSQAERDLEQIEKQLSYLARQGISEMSDDGISRRRRSYDELKKQQSDLRWEVRMERKKAAGVQNPNVVDVRFQS